MLSACPEHRDRRLLQSDPRHKSTVREAQDIPARVAGELAWGLRFVNISTEGDQLLYYQNIEHELLVNDTRYGNYCAEAESTIA